MDKLLLLDPLGFLRTEVYRQRVACNTLEALSSGADNGGVRADAERVLRFILEDLPVHTADLEECLFPLLRQRVLPSDALEAELAQYRDECDCGSKSIERLVDALREIAEGAPQPADLPADARAFAESRRRCLARETDVILPLAELRITGADLVVLGEALAGRRGVSHPT